MRTNYGEKNLETYPRVFCFSTTMSMDTNLPLIHQIWLWLKCIFSTKWKSKRSLIFSQRKGNSSCEGHRFLEFSVLSKILIKYSHLYKLLWLLWWHNWTSICFLLTKGWLISLPKSEANFLSRVVTMDGIWIHLYDPVNRAAIDEIGTLSFSKA